MNIYTQDICTIVRCDVDRAQRIQNEMGASGFSFSNSTMEEFKKEVLSVATEIAWPVQTTTTQGDNKMIVTTSQEKEIKDQLAKIVKDWDELTENNRWAWVQDAIDSICETGHFEVAA